MPTWTSGQDSLKAAGHYSGTPNLHNLFEKYWQCTSNLYRSTHPICNAVPCRLLSLEERETPQYASHLYCSTPPICTAVRLPFVPALLLRKYQGWGVRKVPDFQQRNSRNLHGDLVPHHKAAYTNQWGRSSERTATACCFTHKQTLSKHQAFGS